ncbi:efflux RND transporter permease subunit [Sporosarcina sp. FSL K6-3457]|uniref:efflux RND transporter permease subunit n=1 Tax=Sporosarcina sp. FSL K6-3457 TaxID=2978204 RepID=UPI0030F4C57A
MAVKRSVAVTLLLVGIVVTGIFCLQKFNVELMPEFKLSMAFITANYPNASAEEVDQKITVPLEQLLKEDQDIKSVSSTSSKGSSSIFVTFKSNINLEKKIQDLQMKIDGSRSMMPAGVQSLVISDYNRSMGREPVIGFSILGAKGDESFLQRIESEIANIQGVAEVKFRGSNVRQLRINLNSQQLAAYKLTTSDLLKALTKNSVQTIGTIQESGKELQLVVPEEQYTIAAIEQTKIPTADGLFISIRDIADISIVSNEEKNLYTINDKPTIGFSVVKESNANIVEVTDAILEKIETLKETLPQGIDIQIGDNAGIFVKDSIKQVTNNLIMGGLLASAVLLFFFKSFRILVIIVLSIPISIIMALIALYFSGQTLNVLSLAGLALGVGMMVDSSIVILENIIKYKQQGYPIFEAVKQGSKELRQAVIASTLTTIIVFSPLFFIGDLKSLTMPFALAVIFTLIASLLAAITIVPMLSYKWMGSEKVVIQNNAKWLSGLINQYQKVLKWSLKKRWVPVLVALALSIGSLFLIPLIGFEAITVEDDGRIHMDASMHGKLSEDELLLLIKQLDDAIEPFDNIIQVKEKSVEQGYISYFIQLVPKSERKEQLQEILAQVKQSLAPSSMVSLYINGEELEVFDANREQRIDVTLSGTNYEVLTALTEQVTLFLENTPGIVDIDVPDISGEPQLKLVVNNALAAKYGLDREQIVMQMQEAVMNDEVMRFSENETDYRVYVNYANRQTDTMAFWENLNVKTASGDHIPLFAVASFESTQGPISIQRKGFKQGITVRASVAATDETGEIINEFNRMLEEIPFPPEYGYEFYSFDTGDEELITKLIVAIVAAIGLVYAVLAIQFNSYSQPIIIMLAIPPTIIGVVLGLLLTGKPLSPMVALGIIILAGIVVNNSILLVDYINQRKEENWDRTMVVIAAGKERLRPILMTTLTTVLGMIPLAMGLGDGASLQQPIGIVTIFGLSVSTLFTLVFIPVVYTLFDDCSNVLTRLSKKATRKLVVKQKTAA